MSMEQIDPPVPTSVGIIGGIARPGTSVRLHPKRQTDAFGLLLEQRIGRVEEILQDMEDRLYLAVTLDDDPGREQEDERILPGHRFFFYPEELEMVQEQRPV